jgi:hypothetical protein
LRSLFLPSHNGRNKNRTREAEIEIASRGSVDVET